MNLPKLKELIGELVNRDTQTYKSNDDLADFLEQYLKRNGFEVRTQEVNEDGIKGVNVVGKKLPTNGPYTGGLLLAGHTDTVPVSEGWVYDPFELTQEGDKWYGLGICDMKSSIGIFLQLAEDFRYIISKPLTLAFTYGEEGGFKSGMKGVKNLVQANLIDSEFGILGEPSDIQVERGHKGFIGFDIVVKGKASHSSRPDQGISAIEKSLPIQQKIKEIKEDSERNTDWYNMDFDPPYPILTIGEIHGGTARNIIPNSCLLKCSLRTLPEQNYDIMNDIKGFLKIYKEASLEVFGETQPFLLPVDLGDIKRLEKITGKKSATSPAATEAVWYNKAGIPTVMLGPGRLYEQAHIPNEYITMDQVVNGYETFMRVLKEFCL